MILLVVELAIREYKADGSGIWKMEDFPYA
jgi:hypothetical protein